MADNLAVLSRGDEDIYYGDYDFFSFFLSLFYFVIFFCFFWPTSFPFFFSFFFAPIECDWTAIRSAQRISLHPLNFSLGGGGGGGGGFCGAFDVLVPFQKSGASG